jgi:hypothetical protein
MLTLNTLAFVLLVLLGVVSPVVRGQSCSTDPIALRAARLNATRAYVTRLNYDLATYIARSDRYYTEDTRFVLRGIGFFDTLQVAKEYGFVLFNETTFTAIDLRELFQGKIFQVLDEPTLTWADDEDTVQFWQTADVRLAPVFDQPGQFLLASGGVRNFETIRFEACSDRIKSDMVVSDRAIMPLYTANNQVDIATLCERIMARCTGDLQQYASVEDCLAFMQVLNAREAASPESACPYRLTSNSTTCRNFHTTNALVDPAVHCSHTAINSPKCVDTCLPACADCPARSHCTSTYANATTEVAVYACACDDGFVAGSVGPNGATSCVPVTCTADWQCGTPYGFCDTISSRCACPYTFEWDPINGGCHCPTDYVLTWDVPANNAFGLTAPACKPPGGCLARQHCTDQAWNRVQCAATSPPSTVSPWLACQCNPGFIGGWISPCQCPYGESRVMWSSTVLGDVCLAPGECTDDWHCGYSGDAHQRTCTPVAGSILGTCA